jgi:predicted choloylglycine hydrolase
VSAALTFRFKKDEGERWGQEFARLWPAYRAWFLSAGEALRPSYLRSRNAIARHLPELLALFDAQVDRAGGGDLEARFLSMWCPPANWVACSQAAQAGAFLVRNYDYSPAACEAVVWSTRWNQRVLGTSDCCWGLLDGVNEAGLAASLAFGGRRAVGEGFGAPLLVRGVLELCDSIRAACELLQRVPVYMPYNITLADRDSVVTVEIAPDRAPVVRRAPYAVNMQGAIDWEEHAEAAGTRERAGALAALTLRGGEYWRAFLRPPLYRRDYGRAMGTLYTATFHLQEGRAVYRWPGVTVRASFDQMPEAAPRITYVSA